MAEAVPGYTLEIIKPNPMNVKPFRWNDKILNALEASISPERMATYITASDGDREKALRLYTWNTAISAAFYGPLQGLEVTLRNAMHRQLAISYGTDWYDNAACGLNPGAIQRIREAKKKLGKGGYAVDTPHIIAELPFGFWVSLLGRGGEGYNYEMKLWRPALYRAFPHVRLKRSQTYTPLGYLLTFRNRIAHHEPIFNRHLQADFDSILKVTGWICPETAEWIAHHSRVQSMLEASAHAGSLSF